LTVTLKTIADDCGLAVSTVSNILNDNKSSFASEKVKQKVKETAKRLGYRKHYLSVSLRTKQTMSIGLCIDRVEDQTRAFFINTFVTAFNKAGYEVAINEHLGNPDRAVAALTSFDERYKDGIVFFTDFLKDIKEKKNTLLKTIQDCHCKVLGIGSELKGHLPCLDIDREWAFTDALSRLEEKNSNILIVYKSEIEFRTAFPKLQKENIIHMPSIYSIDDFIQSWEKLKSKHSEITSIFFRTDEIAIPALRYFHQKGVAIPQTYKVISFDHFSFSQFTIPSLTTYDINFSNLGSLAFEKLYKGLMEEKSLPVDLHQTIEPVFISRESHI
jgi:DNA-binding LacI/PurR family transcriptional regulator